MQNVHIVLYVQCFVKFITSCYWQIIVMSNVFFYRNWITRHTHISDVDVGQQEGPLFSVHDILAFLSDFDGLPVPPCCLIWFPANNCRLFVVSDEIFCVDMVCDRRFVLLWLRLFPSTSGVFHSFVAYNSTSCQPMSVLKFCGSLCNEWCSLCSMYDVIRCFVYWMIHSYVVYIWLNA